MTDFGGLSANQINSGMGLGPGGVGDQSQAVYNNLYGPQGFGGQTAEYAACWRGCWSQHWRFWRLWRHERSVQALSVAITRWTRWPLAVLQTPLGCKQAVTVHVHLHLVEALAVLQTPRGCNKAVKAHVHPRFPVAPDPSKFRKGHLIVLRRRITVVEARR